jgi:hypothetical protein
MRFCATVSHPCPLAKVAFGSVHVDWGIDSEHVLCRDQNVASGPARRHLFTLQHLQSQRQDLAAVAIEKIGHRAKHDAVAIVGMDHLVRTGTAMDRRVAALADNHRVGHPARGLGGELCCKRRRVIERRQQDLRPALLDKETSQLRLRLEKVAAAIELCWRYVRKLPIEALADPRDAGLNGRRGILEASQNGSRKQATRPRRQRKSSQCLAGEAAGLAIVRCVEGRVAGTGLAVVLARK